MIKVDYAIIHQAGADCRSTHEFLQQSFTDLKQQLGGLREGWAGDGQQAYLQLQNEWDTAFADLTELLNQIALALPEIADGFAGTEKAVTDLMSQR